MRRARWSQTNARGMSDASDTKDGLRASLRDLVALHGVSGFEQPLVAYFQKRVAGLADQAEVDRYGNVTALKRGLRRLPFHRQAHDKLATFAGAVTQRLD